MNSSFQAIMQKKSSLIALVVVGVVIIIGCITLIVIDIGKKSTNKTTVTTQLSPTPLKDLEQSHSELKQTLEQEKVDRAKAREALAAPSQYQKLAQ